MLALPVSSQLIEMRALRAALNRAYVTVEF
jgi:hypothetical protein